MAHPDFSLQFQGKVEVGFLPLAHFFGPPPFSSHMSHICNTKKWAKGQKSGPLDIERKPYLAQKRPLVEDLLTSQGSPDRFIDPGITLEEVVFQL